MTARQVHAVLAAGVENPVLIERWQENPRLLLDEGVDPGSLDLVALRKFAGLTVKVRHNGMRQDYPLTFRFMNVAGLDIEIFASYAVFRAAAGKAWATTAAGRARDLIAFLEQWLDRRRTDHSLFWDLIRHEHALAELSRSAAMQPTPAFASTGIPVTSEPTGKSVPKIQGMIVLHEMHCDPRAVGALLRERAPVLDRIASGPRFFCYWRREWIPELQILELDAFGYFALSFVDGICSAADVSRRLGGRLRPTRGFLRSLGQLAAAGILEFEPPLRTRNR